MIPKNRAPTRPGVILEEEFLKPLGMTQAALAKRMAVPIQRANTIVTGKRGITADTVLLLAEVFDSSTEFWMNLQNRVDLWQARKERAKKVG